MTPVRVLCQRYAVNAIFKHSAEQAWTVIKVGACRRSWLLLDIGFLITSQHVVTQVVRFLHFLLALFSGFQNSHGGILCQSQVISGRRCYYWQFYNCRKVPSDGIRLIDGCTFLFPTLATKSWSTGQRLENSRLQTVLRLQNGSKKMSQSERVCGLGEGHTMWSRPDEAWGFMQDNQRHLMLIRPAGFSERGLSVWQKAAERGGRLWVCTGFARGSFNPENIFHTIFFLFEQKAVAKRVKGGKCHRYYICDHAGRGLAFGGSKNGLLHLFCQSQCL